MLLLRLWHLQATGENPDDERLRGIHGMTEFVRAIQAAHGAEALALVGAPLRTRDEMYDAIERHRAVAARVGQALAARLGFVYPDALEEMVRREWELFRRGEEPNA